jgi:hypothetical protein
LIYAINEEVVEVVIKRGIRRGKIRVKWWFKRCHYITFIIIKN